MNQIVDSIKNHLIRLIRNTVENSPEQGILFGNVVITIDEPNTGSGDYPANTVQLIGVEFTDSGQQIVVIGEYDAEAESDEDPEPIELNELSCDTLIEILHTIHADGNRGDEIAAEFAAFISYSTLVDGELREWIEDNVNPSMPFSYGDCNRSLVTAKDLADHIENVISNQGLEPVDDEDEEEQLENAEGSPTPEQCQAFLNRVRNLGDIYVDLAN